MRSADRRTQQAVTNSAVIACVRLAKVNKRQDHQSGRIVLRTQCKYQTNKNNGPLARNLWKRAINWSWETQTIWLMLTNKKMENWWLSVRLSGRPSVYGYKQRPSSLSWLLLMETKFNYPVLLTVFTIAIHFVLRRGVFSSVRSPKRKGMKNRITRVLSFNNLPNNIHSVSRNEL